MDSGIAFLLGLGILLAILGFAGIRQIPPGFAGTVVTLGRPGRNVRAGWTWIMPLIQWIEVIDARIIQINPVIEDILNADGVPVRVDLFMTRQVVNPRKAMFEVRDPDRALNEIILGPLVTQVGLRRTLELQREEVKNEITQTLEENIDEVARPRFGMDVDNVQIQRFRFPPELESAFTTVQSAEQRRQAAVITAKAEAEVVRIEQEAEGPGWIPKTWADTIRDVGLALADALKGKGGES